MKKLIRLLRRSMFVWALCLSIFHTSAQSVDGIYSSSEYSLHLQENSDGVVGVFIDSDGMYYNVFFVRDEDGLIGMVDELYAFIPWDNETMILYLMPPDENDKPDVNQAVEISLEYVSGLYEESNQIDYSQLSYMPIKKFGSDFYPSYVLATSTWSEAIDYAYEEGNYKYYGDQNGYFGVNLQGFPIGSIVRVEVEGEPLVHKSSYSATITHNGMSEIFPIIEYNYDALKNVSQAKPVNFKFRVYLNNELLEEKLETVWVRSVNDAVTNAIDHHDRPYNFEFIFAAFVNENDPGLDPVLGRILDYGIVNSWIGYQGSENDVLNQVFALWYHFQLNGFRYSSITTQSGSDQRSFGQVVRFVGDALNTTQANCIDGTVLFASFLYKIGIKTSIVLVPGHAYLAFGATADGSKKYALETTMLGSVDIQNSGSVQDSYNSFINAINTATETYANDALPNIQNGNPEYMEIDIGEARNNQIRPIK